MISEAEEIPDKSEPDPTDVTNSTRIVSHAGGLEPPPPNDNAHRSFRSLSSASALPAFDISSMGTYKNTVAVVIGALLIRSAIEAPTAFLFTTWKIGALLAIYDLGRRLLGYTTRHWILGRLEDVMEVVGAWITWQYNCLLDNLAARLAQKLDKIRNVRDGNEAITGSDSAFS